MKPISLSSGFALALAALAPSFAPAAELDADWSIVYPDAPVGADGGTDYAMRVFARDLALDFEEATGRKIPVVPQSKAKATTKGLWLGAPAAKAAGYSFADWTFFDNAYGATNGNVYCFGNDRFCVKNKPAWETHRELFPSARAAMRFMRDVVHARYVMPERLGVCIPKATGALSLPDGSYSPEKPNIRYGSSRSNVPFRYANNDFPPGAIHDYGGHSFPSAIPAEVCERHPEYLAVRADGVRPKKLGSCTAYCLSNPEVQELIFQEAKKRFEEGSDICQVSQTDGDPRCYCEKCTALYGTGRDWGEKFWIFFRKIAERAARECPGKTVIFLAYGVNAQPPKTFRSFPKNTMVQLCSYDEATFKRWSEIDVPGGFSVYLYLWGNYHKLGFTPKRSFAGLAELANRFRRYHVTGVYRCGNGELPGLEGPQYYYFGRLVENPSAGISETLKEFCDAAFGAEAGEPMFRFYETLDQRLRVNDRIGTGHWEADSPDVSKWANPDQKRLLDLLAYIYTPDTVSTMDGCLAHAKRCRLTDRERARLKRVEAEWLYARNLGRIANLYNGYWTAPTFEKLEPLLHEIRWRNAYLDRLYAPRAKDAKTPEWLSIPMFGGNPRAMVQRHSRLAPMYEPLNWDVATMLRDRLAPGAPSEVARWKKYNAEHGLKPITGWRPDRKNADLTFEVRPDGRGFAFDPGAAMDLRVGRSFGAQDGLKTNTTYRLSWFVRLEDVRVKPRYLEFGFFALAPADAKHDVLEPSGGMGLTGSCDWRHMSLTFTTGDDPKFSSYIRFRLLTGRGRVEIEDVTLEELPGR